MASPSVTRPIPFELPELQLKPGFFLLLAILFAFAQADPIILAAIIGSIAAHELGHIAPALACGVRVKAIGANFAGCFNRREAARDSFTEAIIIGGGLLATLMIALATAGTVSRFNWFLLLANALPSPWSDGGRLLKVLMR